MPDHDSKDYYDDLEKTLNHAHMLLEGAVTQLESLLRTPVLSTIRQDTADAPSVSSRMVVMREFDCRQRQLSFYTDMRSSKVSEIENNPAVSVLFYDPDTKVQLRLSGHSTIHRNDDATATIWQTVPTRNKALYGTEPAPGTHLSAGDDYSIGGGVSQNDDEQYFCLIKVNYHQLEWLYLARQGHRRALYRWHSAEDFTSQWLAP